MTDMQYRILGRTGLKVSVIGFGASPLGAEFGPIDPDEGRRAVNEAIEQGINYFDVAPYYGRTLAEKRLGQFLKSKRDQVILATKVGRYGINYPEGFDYSAPKIMQSIEDSLQRLQTDYVDILQIHDIEYAHQKKLIEETIPALQQLKKEGKCRFIGITGYPLTPLKEIAESQAIDTVLSYCRYNLLDQSLDKILTPTLKKREISLINASPLHMRVLTEKGAPHWHPAPEWVFYAVRKVVKICRKFGINISNLAIQYALLHPYTSVLLIGMSKRKHVWDNLRNIGQYPNQELLSEVITVLKPIQNIYWQEGLPENNDPGAIEKRTMGLERDYQLKKGE